MTLDDAIFNWLQIKYVAEQRLDDQAAQETYEFFSTILEEDFKMSEIRVEQKDGMYIVTYMNEEQKKEKQFPIEFVRQLLEDISKEPKYNQ